MGTELGQEVKGSREDLSAEGPVQCEGARLEVRGPAIEQWGG